MASYVYGNTARKELQPVPQRPVQKKQEVRGRVQKSNMSRGYVVFLAAAAIVALFACTQYLQLQSESSNLSKSITAMQQELADAKEANTTRYNAIVNSMNLEEVREKAMNELGMVYASEEQIITYKSPTSNVVTQYAGIPKSGILASVDEIE